MDQLLAPVALYPDSLLAQVLTAATYPAEVVQAARFVARNPNLKGDALSRSISGKAWDASVTSLAQFPSVLAMMSDKLEWTQQLGDAFLDRPDVVMDTVQSLRAKAQSAGYLQSNAQQTVAMQEQYIVIEPARPQVVFVRYYNPLVVYGSWWWPTRPPWNWVPPPIYRPPGWVVGPNLEQAIFWGVAVGITRSIWFDARPSWRDRQVTIININRPGYSSGVWQHNPVHRGGVAYRDVRTRDRFRLVDKTAVVDRRESWRGRDPAVKLPPARPRPVTRPGTRPETRPEMLSAPKPAVQPTRGPNSRPVTRPVTRPIARPAPSPTARPAPPSRERRDVVRPPEAPDDAQRQMPSRER